MRILAVNPDYTLNGASRLMLRLAEHLRHAGHAVTACAALAAPGPLALAFREDGFALLDRPSQGAFDLAICNTVTTARHLLWLARSMKTIWWIHEGVVGRNLLAANPAQRAAFATARAVVFPTAHLKDAIYGPFIEAFDQSRFVVLPNGVPPLAAPGPRASGGRQLRVVSVGSVYPRKRHEDLIRAIARLGHADARCVIAGQFYFLPEDCMQIVAADPRTFELTGELDHGAALALIAGADLFCLPSDDEVMPLTALEAAMLGTPMVLSDLPAYAGLWRHGHTCLLHPVGDAAMLRQSIATLAADPDLRAKLGAAARQTAQHFSEAAFLARFDSVIEGL